MKRILVFVLALMVASAGFGQGKETDNSKYLAQDAVIMKDGKVVFSDEVKLVPGCSQQQASEIAVAWLEKFLEQGNKGRNRIVTNEGHKITAVAQMELVFQRSSFALDKADMDYVLTLCIKDGECTLDMDRIRYNYNDGTGYEIIVAENYITYSDAVNKKGTKLLPITGKFRRKTIDAAEEIFVSFREGMKYCTAQGQAELAKVMPQIAAAVPQTTEPQTAALQAAAPQGAVSQNVALQSVADQQEQVSDETAGMEGYRKIDPDKIHGNGLKMITVMETSDTYSIAFYAEGDTQARMIVECKKTKKAAQPMHKMYIGEILNVWVK